ncbi:cysteine-rich secretory protein family [Bellilinea caldifistulae]|uniref:CAP domain-containing protein n=1 Tax=Bellilinea caldifistulae TaxID=360411 RepID=UPI000B13BE96|nr:CAP domain-containing protein [Bellilinea caldifistulae]GAP09167.1 cysteine-rich secretory protein family [Bellilinea caldifistulae]
MPTLSRTMLLTGIFLLLAGLFWQPLPAVRASPAAQSTPEVACDDYKVYLPLIANAPASQPNQPTNTCLTGEEEKLGNLINAYRREKGLPPVTFSQSLTRVAQAHVRDLYENRPNTGECNLHSWSDKGNWTPVCYTPDHKNASGMWLKPKEITNGIYTGYGFEIAYWHSARATADGAFAAWKASSGHNAVMIEDSIWKGMNWGAMGIGIYQNYAVVWFGQPADPLGSATACPR